MRRPSLSAEAIRDELNQAALRYSLDGEGASIDFMLPTRAEPVDATSPNWDVEAECPEGLDELARHAEAGVADHHPGLPGQAREFEPDASGGRRGVCLFAGLV